MSINSGTRATAAAALLIALGIPAAATGASTPTSETDPRRDVVVNAVQKVMPCVVNIATEEVVAVRDPLEDIFREFFDPYYRRSPRNTQYSLGSGVIIDEEGFVLTNFHVVNRARRIWVKLSDGREYECEKVSSTQLSDVALLRIKAKEGDKFSAVKFAADDDLLVGETVLALGNPFGLGGTVTRGILSSMSRRPPRENEQLDVLDWLQTDAAINPGNSGGPLVNLRGEMIGLNVAIYREAQGIGFAVPIKRVAAAISEIYSPEWVAKLWFGARVRPAGLPLQVTSVQTESPAGKAGLRPGDLISQLNGKPPRSFTDFIKQLIDIKDDADVTLTVQRDTEKRTVKVRQVPEDTFFNADMIRKKLGLSVQELSPELAVGMGLGRLEGLLIGGVDRGGSGPSSGLDRGMLITALDDQRTSSIVTAAKLLYGKRKGEKVKLDLIVPRQHGPFLQLRQFVAEVAVK
jgi:S1-C subfamily serine protease